MGSNPKRCKLKLTDSHLRALSHLAEREYATPSELGYAISTRTRIVPMKPQGAGRLGGGIGSRLVEAGLAWRHTTQYRGQVWPLGYCINGAGRLALAQAQRAAPTEGDGEGEGDGNAG